MADAELEVKKQAGVTVVVLGEEYDNLDEPTLNAAAEELLEIARTANPPRIVIDMHRTKFFGSSFLGTLFRMWRRLTTRQGKMAVCGATGVCAEVLNVTQVERLWNLYDSRDAAVEAINS